MNKQENISDICIGEGLNINWFPGHMAKTKKQIIEDLKLVDVAIVLLDARIPLSSQNPDLKQILQGKPVIVLLNKADLADDMASKEWKTYFEGRNGRAIIVDSNSGKGIPEVIQELERMKEENRQKLEGKGRIGKSIRVMVVGIPNVGKSSFINRVSKKTAAQVGNKPGVTKQKQWVRVNQEIELLDTPGVLWPKLDQEVVALNLSYTGTIKDEILPTIEIGYQLVKKLKEDYTKNLIERYKLEAERLQEIANSELEENEKVIEIMNEIGKKRGAIISGGEVDLEKVAGIVLDDFRKGRLGKITLEKPNHR